MSEKYVRSLAFGYARKFDMWHHFDDLAQEARIGFWVASRRFPDDPNFARSFGCLYAKRQMSHYIRALRRRPLGTDAGLEQLIDETDLDQPVLVGQVLKAVAASGSTRDGEIFLRSAMVDRGQRVRGVEEPGSERALAREFGIDRQTVKRINTRMRVAVLERLCG